MIKIIYLIGLCMIIIISACNKEIEDYWIEIPTIKENCPEGYICIISNDIPKSMEINDGLGPYLNITYDKIGDLNLSS